MKVSRTFFMVELKRLFSKRRIVIILLPLFFALWFIQDGIDEYQETLYQKETFKTIEKIKFEQQMNYRQYGNRGFRIMFIPSPFAVFSSNSGVITDMNSFVDTSERLRIYNPLKGKNLFDLKESGFTDFSGIILFFGSLLALFYGFTTFGHKEYSRYLASLSSVRLTFFSLMISRMLLLVMVEALFVGCGLLLVILNGLSIPINSFFAALLAAVVVVGLIFFIMGAIFGTMKSKINGIIHLISAWFILLFFLPNAIDSYVAKEAQAMTSIHKLHIDKLKLLSNFEKRVSQKFAMHKSRKDWPREELQAMMETYWDNEFKQIHQKEIEMKTETMHLIDKHQRFSSLFPSTFYSLVSNEISSKGYRNYIHFCTHLLDLKKGFTRFYIDKNFYGDNNSKVEPFIPGQKNIYYGRSQLPTSFTFGAVLHLFYVVILSWFAYFRFRRSVFNGPGRENTDLNNPGLKLEKGQSRVFLVEDLDCRFKNQLYCLMAGATRDYERMGYSDKIYIDGHDAIAQPVPRDFLYLCSPTALVPDITAGDFIRLAAGILKLSAKERKAWLAQPGIAPLLNKTIGQLHKLERGELLLAVLGMKQKDIYLIYDIGRGMSIEFAARLKEKMEELQQKGALVVYLTTDDLLLVKSVKKDQSFFETTSWGELVERYSGLRKYSDPEE